MGRVAAGDARAAVALAVPFRWTGLADDGNVDTSGRPRPPVTSRFTDPTRSFLAPFVRLLRGLVDPRHVPDLTPSMVAMSLGWDQQYAVRAIAWDEEAAEAFARMTQEQAQVIGTTDTPRVQRLRRIELEEA